MQSFKAVVLAAALAAAALAGQSADGGTPYPPEGTLVRVPCEGAGAEGIVVRISTPARARYPEGAPVVVHATAGRGVDGFPLRLTEFGFIELHFLWVGNSSKPQPDGKTWSSGGTAALGTFFETPAVRGAAAVLAFATGRTKTLEGKTLQDYAQGTHVLTGNAGVIGWSVGGNLVAAAMGLYGSEFPGLQWYASFESPFGDGMLDGEFGTHFQPNRFYSSARGALDLTLLRYGKDLPITDWSGRTPTGAESVRGSLYLDGNKNGTFEKESDFLFSGIFRRSPSPNVFYSPSLTRTARDQAVFGTEWPAHIADVAQTEKFFHLQDGVSHIEEIRKNIPGLAVVVQGSVEDHVATVPDHRHIYTQYDTFRKAGVRWIRLNPDSHYVEWVLGHRPSRVVQNGAGKMFDRMAIVPALELSPAEGGPTPEEAMAATACELADRVRTKNWGPTLSGVLLPNAPKSLR